MINEQVDRWMCGGWVKWLVYRLTTGRSLKTSNTLTRTPCTQHSLRSSVGKHRFNEDETECPKFRQHKTRLRLTCGWMCEWVKQVVSWWLTAWLIEWFVKHFKHRDSTPCTQQSLRSSAGVSGHFNGNKKQNEPTANAETVSRLDALLCSSHTRRQRTTTETSTAATTAVQCRSVCRKTLQHPVENKEANSSFTCISFHAYRLIFEASYWILTFGCQHWAHGYTRTKGNIVITSIRIIKTLFLSQTITTSRP